MATKAEKHELCAGCRDNYYNQPGIGECWSLSSAKVVKRWRLGWWTSPATPGAFREVKTLSCHHAPGRYALCERLPAFAVDPVRLERAS